MNKANLVTIFEMVLNLEQMESTMPTDATYTQSQRQQLTKFANEHGITMKNRMALLMTSRRIYCV